MANLHYQGGIFNKDQVKEAQKDPFCQSKLVVRRWDDAAKDPKMKTRPLDFYKHIAVRSLLTSWSSIEVHNRTYSLPTRPTVAICIDGFNPEYLEQGIADGILPNISKLLKSGFHTTADCAMPSFTVSSFIFSDPLQVCPERLKDCTIKPIQQLPLPPLLSRVFSQNIRTPITAVSSQALPLPPTESRATSSSTERQARNT